MSERGRMEAIAAALADLFQDGSILLNDYTTPQTASRKRAPWAIVAMGDEFIATPGTAWSTPSAVYQVHLTLLDYRGGRSEMERLDAFQSLRQIVINTLLSVRYLVDRIEATTLIGPYFTEDGEPDPDSIAQTVTIHMTDYEV